MPTTLKDNLSNGRKYLQIFDKGLIFKVYKNLYNLVTKIHTMWLKMVRGPELTFSQRHSDDPQKHEKVFKSTNHQGNENQNHDKLLPYSS